ncbi:MULTISPECIES: ACP S-malonyltransferase [Actinomyces]|uniref:[acyl-carrier-protein] S-malonyltransferase n=1 Tax=Actinomyces respiraculi TaxID=2744574 RepID=A0A7T0PY12_9ACTO|nr:MULTISPECIES: ACP S-malonyltransferase [Actinomyces]QPL06365.1 ACP S-malonyltransferase [Actinomyces respiraculi]
MRAILCPGQGSRPTALLPDVEDGAPQQESVGSSPVPKAVRRLVREASAVCGLDLPKLVRQSVENPDGEPLGTHVAQPLTVLISLLSALRVGLLGPAEGERAALDGPQPGTVVAGHSLGSVTALALAGALSPLEAVRLAAVRGRAMASCCTADDGTRLGGMSAVVGGEREDVLAQIHAAGLTVANVNGATQVVASGTFEALARLSAPTGARLVPLDVAGPFHCPLLAGAAPALEQAVRCLPDRPLLRPVVDDATGELHPVGTSSRVLLEALAGKLTAPVRWDLVQERLVALGTDEAVVLAPAQVLAGLARRGLPGVRLTRLS